MRTTNDRLVVTLGLKDCIVVHTPDATLVAIADKDEAIEITSEEIYERFLKYLQGCANLFRDGYTDVAQFTCEKQALTAV